MMELKTFEKATMATTGMASAVALMAGAASAQDQAFDGFYMGLSVSSLSGDVPIGEDVHSDDYALTSDATFGTFVGVNKRIGDGNMVVGAELAFQGKTETDLDGSEYEPYAINHVIDLKGKVGNVVNMGNATPVLLYGFAGMSTGSASNYWGQDYNFSGFNYGVGAEMAVRENFSVGLEVLGRTVDSYNYYDRSNTDHMQVSLRGAFHF